MGGTAKKSWSAQKLVLGEAYLINPNNQEVALFYATDGLDEPTIFPAHETAEKAALALQSHDDLVKALVDLAVSSRAILRECEVGVGLKAKAAAGNAYERAYELVGDEIDAVLAGASS